MNRLNVFELLRKLGWKLFLDKAAKRLWSQKSLFGLRCDLSSMPEPPTAKVKVDMQPFDPKTFSGFRDEYRHATGEEVMELIEREGFCQAGVLTPYVTLGPDGTPAYTQWLITPETQDLLERHEPGIHVHFSPDEALVEGAYTFAAHRGKGIMIDGMAQLLRKAMEKGLRAVYTKVGTNNVASLRGCAKVGFKPDHVRISTRRLGREKTVLRPMDAYWQKVWDDAVAPKK